MELTKHAHACVTVDKGSGRVVLDPGTFTTNAAELVANATAVLITHEHFDHFDEDVLTEALKTRSDLRVYGPGAVVGRWLADHGDRVKAVSPGDEFEAGGFGVSVFGGIHALIHADIPQVANVGFLIDERVYHPGDSYHVPLAPVETLLLPTSGPWTVVGEAVNFVREVGPQQLVQIHESMLSELGQQSVARLLSPPGLTQVPLAIVPAGETISA